MQGDSSFYKANFQNALWLQGCRARRAGWYRPRHCLPLWLRPRGRDPGLRVVGPVFERIGLDHWLPIPTQERRRWYNKSRAVLGRDDAAIRSESRESEEGLPSAQWRGLHRILRRQCQASGAFLSDGVRDEIDSL